MALFKFTRLHFWLNRHDFIDEALRQLEQNKERPEKAQNIVRKALRVLPPSKIYEFDDYRLKNLVIALLAAAGDDLVLKKKVIEVGFAISSILQRYYDSTIFAAALNEELFKTGADPLLKGLTLIHAIRAYYHMARMRNDKGLDEFRQNMFGLCSDDSQLAARVARESLAAHKPLAFFHSSKLNALLEDQLKAAGDDRELKVDIIKSAASALSLVPAHNYFGDSIQIIKTLLAASGGDDVLDGIIVDTGIAYMNKLDHSHEWFAREFHALCKDMPALQQKVRAAIIDKIMAGAETSDRAFIDLRSILSLGQKVFDGLAFRTASGSDIFMSWANDRSGVSFAVRQEPTKTISYDVGSFKGTANEIGRRIKVESVGPERQAVILQFIASAQQALGHEPAPDLPNLAQALNARIEQSALLQAA